MHADHARIAELVANACPHDGVDYGTYQRFRSGLLRHIGIEEKILMPALRLLNGGQDLPLVREVKLDHAALSALLVPTPTREIIARLTRLLEQHDALEEGPDGLYAACDRLAPAELDALIARMETAPPVSLAPYRDGPKTFETIERVMAAAGRK